MPFQEFLRGSDSGESMMSHLALNSIFLVVVALVSNGKLLGQDSAPQESSQQGRTEETSVVKKKNSSLVDVTRVSTRDATLSATEVSAKKGARGDSPRNASNPDVLELRHVARDDEAAGGVAVPPSKESKKSRLGNVHGTVYGATGSQAPRNKAAGGAVGVSTKDGRTSIYIEAERSRVDSPSR